MQNKPKSRTDVQWVISSVSLAATVGMWGLFASADKQGAGVSGQANLVQPTADPPQQVVVSQQPQALLPGQVLLFGGTAPQPSQSAITTITGTTNNTSPNVKHRSGGGGKPVTSTGSSKPKP
jgi:hypothetical protein